jgi:NAD(P)-dependent dehydrogenase (short-subunit alcohol dehydrogenase family)
MDRLKGKVAVVTGGSSGIGRATAQLFAAEGAFVFITGRRQDELDAAVAEIGANTVGVRGDIANLADLDRLFQRIKTEKGRIDILFANAGVGELLPLGAITEASFDKTFNVNVKGTLFTVQKALPLMPRGSSIVLNASMVSVKGMPAFSVYAATKAALVRAQLDRRSERPSNPCKRREPRYRPYTGLRPAWFDQRSVDGVHRITGCRNPAWAGRRSR